MKGLDSAELMRATIVTHALVRSILNELGTHARLRICADAINYLPPQPNPNDGQPVAEEMWRAAERELKTLAGQ
jgi:hypothetical protein